MVELPVCGWSNKSGTSDRACKCGTWKQHWINFTAKAWPPACSVAPCSGVATVGGHVINCSVSGERIVPFCDSCNKRVGLFSLKLGVSLCSANRAETCG